MARKPRDTQSSLCEAPNDLSSEETLLLMERCQQGMANSRVTREKYLEIIDELGFLERVLDRPKR